jgi:hypothetical protein
MCGVWSALPMKPDQSMYPQQHNPIFDHNSMGQSVAELGAHKVAAAARHTITTKLAAGVYARGTPPRGRPV